MSLPISARLAVLCALMPLSSCACPSAYANRSSACVDAEEGAEDALFGNGVDRPTITGPMVSDDGFVSTGDFDCEPGAHVVTIATDAGRVRFSWGHEDEAINDALAVELADGDVTAEQIIATSFESSGSSFVLRDAEGVAIAIERAFGLREVDDVKVEHGFVRASTPTPCGVAWVTGVRVATADVSHDVWVGTDVALTASGQPMRFHAFHGSRYAPWVCTDSQDTISWALVRDAS